MSTNNKAKVNGKPERRTTIQDVANLVGVSKVTVSYVLNGHGAEARISPETEERVLNAARQLDYRPNALARMLIAKKTDTIAVVFQYGDFFSTLSNFTSEVMGGVCRASVESGMDLMLHTKLASEPVNEANNLMDGRVDGVLMLRDSNDPTLEEVLGQNFPCVLFFTRSYDRDVPFVDADNYTGGRMATQHLLDLGHKRIAMVRGSAKSISSNDRLAGYRDALETAGIELDRSYIVEMTSPRSDPKALFELFEGPDRPTALFAWSDDVAFVCMRILNEMMLSVPEDISIIGFDSSEACDRVTPPLTNPFLIWPMRPP